MTPDERVHRVLASESRTALLAALRTAGRPLSAGEAAESIGLGPSTTRHHLDLLASAGLVDRAAERRATAGRPTIRYSIAPVVERSGPGGGPASGSGATATDDYQRLASVLAGQLSGRADPAGAAREAGRRWTEALDVPRDRQPLEPDAAITEVVELMDRLGFDPERPAGGDRIDLRRCPFEVVAREHRAVVCGVHLGMLEETFERLGGLVSVAELEPFANDEPLLCLVALRRAPDSGTVATDGGDPRDDGRTRTPDRSPSGRGRRG